MPTPARIRRAPDQGRIAAGLRGPGIDTRTWLAKARVDDDPDAIRWAGGDTDDGAKGWLVDVTFVSGPLLNVGPVVCRMMTMGGRVEPIARGAVVVVELTEGSPNAEPVIVGQLFAPDQPPPQTVNGDTIVETDAQAGQVAADVTQIVATPHSLDAQYGARARMCADAMVLGKPDADQPYVRGADFRDAIDALGAAIKEAFRLLAQSGSTSAGGVPLTAAQAAYGATPLLGIQKAITDLENAADAYLSTRINGD